MMLPLALRWMKREQEGSLERFMEKYLQQVISFGYHSAPLEIDARRYEVVD